jgi:hypothetical protein
LQYELSNTSLIHANGNVFSQALSMEKIKISELHPAGSNLFTDAESFLQDLADTEAMAIQGGEGGGFAPYLAYGQKLLEYGVMGFAIANIASIAKSFSAAGIAGGGAPAAPAAPVAPAAPAAPAGPVGAAAPAATHASSVPGLSGTIIYKL